MSTGEILPYLDLFAKFMGVTYLRFADRDMVMRYHWGLGIGHAYSHSSVSGSGYPKSHKNTATDSIDFESASIPPHPDSHNISQASAQPVSKNPHDHEDSSRPNLTQDMQPEPGEVGRNGQGLEADGQVEEGDSNDSGSESGSSSAESEDCDTEDEFTELELHDSYKT